MASRTLTPKPAASKRPLSHPHRVNPTVLGLGLAAIALGGGLALWLLMDAENNAGDPTDLLVAQMQAAAKGENPPPFHALGGALRTIYGQGRINVVAEDVPSGPCVKAGWRLAKTGTLIVNGVLPTRISAARLTELCENGATLTWAPD
ncbi:MAG: hypothetical protein HYU59_13555 [Magnetospirillum gryphiswaldense]|nr:hypothetical protein [Magnetospirillum gryphiswaldense]